MRVIRGSVRTAALAALGLSMLLIGIANAAATDTATVTVQAGALGITINDDVASLGSPDVGGTETTISSTGTGNDLIYENTGTADFSTVGINVVEDTGKDCIFGTGTNWDLSELATPGADAFRLEAATDDNFVVEGNDPVTLQDDNVAIAMPSTATLAAGTQNVDLLIELGTSITTQGAPCTITLLMTATG